MINCLLIALTLLDHPEPTIKLIAPGDKKLISFQCEVTNPSKSSWYFLGYSPESMTPKLPADRIAPMTSVQRKKNGQWVTDFDGRCGVGIVPVELPAGAKATFHAVINLPEGDEARIGITILSTKEWKDTKVIWSEPVKLARKR